MPLMMDADLVGVTLGDTLLVRERVMDDEAVMVAVTEMDGDLERD
jgi:hypothetical protein